MLYWLKFFIFLIICGFFSFFFIYNSLIVLLLNSELLVISLIVAMILTSTIYNINFLIGLSMCYLIFGGMELALNLILFII